jgi:Na+/melibiose symporter-like transporter
MIKLVKVLHIIGLIMLLVGVGLYWQSDIGQQVSGMLVIALLIGVGTLIMSPLPVALVIEWAKKQPLHSDPKE